MEGVIEYNDIGSLTNIKETKKEISKRIKNKLEKAKLELIYSELESLNIPFNRDYSTVKDLTKDLKKKLNSLDYNKVIKKIEEIDNSLNSMVGELDKGSTNAFTKLMTSDVAKTIGKTLGISLAGRTALLLAPTIGSKAVIGAGLAGYGLYRMVKNRKDIIKINEANEINNILMDLEITKENDKYIDTRFSEDAQEVIRNFLKNNDIKFEDTGYLSLRQVIYSLDNDKKRSLCNLINDKLGKGIDIDKRIKSARKKLNVVASTTATMSTGAMLGVQAANVVNTIDPGVTAGVLNGTVLGAWIQSITGKKWFLELSSGLGMVGSVLIEHIPVGGEIARKIFATENLAAFTSVGVAGGLIVGAGLGVASTVRSVYTGIKKKKETQEFLKLDSLKYEDIDKIEINKIEENSHTSVNLVESVLVDLVVGYLKDNDVSINCSIQSIKDLNEFISKLPNNDKKKANDFLNRIHHYIDNEPDVIADFKKVAKTSIALFTAGVAVLSVYDILKGGTFLPELSQKLFPANNIHTPVEVPEGLDIPGDKKIIRTNRPLYEGFTQGEEYMTENNGDYNTMYGANYAANNGGVAAQGAGEALMNYGMNTTLLERIMSFFGIESQAEMVPNIPMITDRLNKLSPKELYEFYRYFNTVPNDNSAMYNAIREVLGYGDLLERATSYITGIDNVQKLHDLVNGVSQKLASGAIPFSIALSTLGIIQKQKTDGEYAIENNGSVKSK